MNICKMKRSTQIAIMTGSGSGSVEKTVTGTAPLTLLDSVAGNIRSITINGRSEVSAGSIVSVGDDGLTVTTCGKNMFNPFVYSEYLQQDGTYRCAPGALTNISTSVKSYIGKTLTFSAYLSRDGNYPTSMRVSATINGVIIGGTLVNANTYTRSTLTITPETENDIINITYGTSGSAEYIYFKDVQLEFGTTATVYEPYNGTMATFTTALPLRSTLDGTVYDELTNEKVITRCEVVDNEVVPLATPVTTPLTDAEISAFRGLRTFDPTTIISVTDNPSITVTYMGKKTTRTAPKKRTSRKKKA